MDNLVNPVLIQNVTQNNKQDSVSPIDPLSPITGTIPPPSQPTFPDQLCGFKITSKLNEGAFGVIYSTEWPKQTNEGTLSISKLKDVLPNSQSDEEIVLKRIKNFNINNKGVVTELNLLSKVNHPYCISSRFISIDDNGEICIVMSKMDYDLHGFLNAFDLSDLNKLDLTYKLMEGLNYLHGNNILHLDLHPGNILVNKKGLIPKITDYGLSKIYENKPYYTDIVLAPIYRAPELLVQNLLNTGPNINSTYQYGPEVDMWTFGILVYYIYTKKYIFSITDDFRVLLLEIQAIVGLTRGQSDQLNKYISNTIAFNPGEVQSFLNYYDDQNSKGLFNINDNIRYRGVVDYLNKYGDNASSRELLVFNADRFNQLRTPGFQMELRRRRFEGLNPDCERIVKSILISDQKRRPSIKQIMEMLLLPTEHKKIVYELETISYSNSYSVGHRVSLLNLVHGMYLGKFITANELIHTIDLADRVFGTKNKENKCDCSSSDAKMNINGEIDNDDMYYYLIGCLNLTLSVMSKQFELSFYIKVLNNPLLKPITKERLEEIQYKILRKVNFVIYRPCLSFLLSGIDERALFYYLNNLSPSSLL